MHPLWIAIMEFASDIGSPPAIVLAVVLLWLWPPTRKRFGVYLAANALLASTLSFLLKQLFAKIRPDLLQFIPESGYGFPSAHALNSMAFYALLAFLTLREAKNVKAGALVAFILLLPPLIIGRSRVFLGIQHPGNVAAGWLLGLLVALVVDTGKQLLDIKKETFNASPRS